MRIREHIKTTFKLALPVSIGQLGHVMLGVVDSIMVGKLGAEPLAAAALANSMMFLILILGIGMSIAVTPLTAIAQGEGRNEDCGILLRQSLFVNGIFSLILFALIFGLSYFLGYMNQPPEVVRLAGSYMRIMGASTLPFMLFQTYRQFIEGLSDTMPPMYISLASNLVNVFGNWVLIYGNLGMPALGLDGAGISSFITRSFMGIGMMLFVIKSERYRQYDPSLRFRNINFPVIKRLVGIGLPSGFQYFLEMTAFSFSTIMIGWLGAIPLAAHQIAINLAATTYMVALGIASAGTIRVGNAFGKKDMPEVRKAGFSAAGMAAVLMGMFGLVFILFNDILPIMYIEEPEVISAASTLLIVAAFFQIFDGTQAAGIGILRGLTDVKVPVIFTFAAYWIIALPVGYTAGFVFELGVTGVWLGFLAGLFVAASFFIGRFYFLTRSNFER